MLGPESKREGMPPEQKKVDCVTSSKNYLCNVSDNTMLNCGLEPAFPEQAQEALPATSHASEDANAGSEPPGISHLAEECGIQAAASNSRSY